MKNRNAIIGSSFATIVLGFLSCPVIATQKADLSADVVSLTAKVTALESKVTALAMDIPKAIIRLKAQSNLLRGPLVVGGIISTTAGSTISWPISYIASTYTATALQFDIGTPSSFTVTGVTAGPAATAAGKTVSFNPIVGANRGIVFGVNQTPMTTGIAAFVQVQISTAVPKGLYSLALFDPVASDKNGNALIMSAITGTVEVK